jgi:outer membrane protein assembly factor BamB
MSESPELLGLAIAVFCIALAVLASTILWRHRAVRLRRTVTAVLVVVAVLLYGYVPGEPPNRPAPLPASTLVYVVMPLELSPGPNSVSQVNTLSAVYARTGATAWTRALPDAFSRNLTLLRDTLYVETFSRTGTVGHICALRGSDGTLLWQYTISQPPDSDPYVLNSGSGILYVPSMGPGVPQTHVTALRAVDGRQLWQWTGQEVSFQYGPIVTANSLYFMSPSSNGGAEIIAINASTGTLLWQTPIEKVIPPAIEDISADAGAVYTIMQGSDNTSDIAALRASDGSLLWTTASGAGRPLFFGSASGAVYIQLDFGIAALRAQDGGLLWRFGSGSDPNSADALEINYVALQAGTLYIAGARSGTSTNSQGQLTNPVVIYALDAASGTQRWRCFTTSIYSGLLDVQPAVVFMYAGDGLTVLDPSNGRLLWHSDAYALAPFIWLSGSDVTPITFMASTPTICRLLLCENRFQMYLSAVDERDGVRYWAVPIGPPQQIYQPLHI